MNDSIPARTDSSVSHSAQEEHQPGAGHRDPSMDASESSIGPGQVRGRRLYSGDFSAPPGQIIAPTAATSHTDQAQESEQYQAVSPQHVSQEVPLEGVPEEPQNISDACFEDWPESNTTNTADKSSDDLEAGSYPTLNTTSALTDTQTLEEMAPPLGKTPLLDEDDPIKEPCPGDPFAPRTGKCLIWRNVNMTLVRILV